MHRSGSQVAGFGLESADLEGALFSAACPRAFDSAVAGHGILDVSLKHDAGLVAAAEGRG